MSTKILVLFALCVLFSLVFAQEEGLLAAPVEAAESTETTTLAEDEEVLSEFDEVETLALPASGQVRIIFDETNKYRVSKGLAKLVWDDILATRAAAHSKNMAASTTLSHNGFPQPRLQGYTYRSAGENVCYNYDAASGLRAMKQWIASPGHEKNLRGGFNRLGVGYAKAANGAHFFTQVFALK